MTLFKNNTISILGLLLLIIAFSSCEDDYKPNPVPDIRVNAVIYLNYHSELNAVGNSKYFEMINGSAVGYKGHGIIVTRKSPQKFIAFDATCPNDVEADSHVEIEGSFAVCPVCDAKFNILIDGSPLNAKSKYPLRTLRTSLKSNKELHIYN